MKFVIRLLCRTLIILVAWTPFQLSHAGMIGTGENVAVTTAQSDRAAVLSIINRADVAQSLQAYGVNPGDAEGRIAAMSDEEVAQLKTDLESAPAAAGDAIWVVAILVGVILWLVFWKRS